jgi:serine/threonine protein kinase
MDENQDSLLGREIDGYRIIDQLGGGGMGEVYRVQKRGEDEVAMKVVRRDLSDDHVKERFQREIRLMMHLRHPHIVPILDHGESDGLLYLIMRIISGPTLRDLLSKQQFTPDSSLEILRPVANALAFMHSTGAMHRDIKPANIFLEEQPEGWHPYIADLGLAKNPRFDRDLPELNRSSGTIEYIAPDLKNWKDLDQQTDVYGLAVIAFEMLLGQLPYDEVRTKSQEHPALMKPSELNPAFPSSLQRVLMHGLHPDKPQRYQSVAAFMHDFETEVARLTTSERSRSYWTNGEV